MTAAAASGAASADNARSVVEPSTLSRWLAGVLVIGYALVALIPLVWIVLTGFKTPSEWPTQIRARWMKFLSLTCFWTWLVFIIFNAIL